MKTPKWKRLLSLVLTVAMVFGLVSMNTFATEGQKSGSETIMVLDTAPSSAETTVGGLYTLDLDTVFSDTSGHSMTYTISGGNFSEHTKIANGTFYFAESTAGTYEPTITATCSEGAEASHTITITVAEGDAGLKSQYGYDETPAGKVTVYVTINNDGMPLLGNDTDQTVLAHAKITVPYFDLALYGLEKFYRYGTENGSGEYINDEVVQRPTALHLYIYLLERYYMGLAEDKCCKGSSGVMEYAEKNDVLYMNGETAYTAAFDALNITGSATSLYMQQFWGHDENLMYYRNHVYPLMSPGWGSTCDYILLSDGDTIDVAMFTDWSFWSDGGGFTKFDKDNYTGEAGSTLTVQTLQFGTRSAADGGIDDFLPVTDMIVGLYDESWQRISEVSGTEGSYTLTLPTKPGTYYLLGTDADAATEDARLAAATAEITVTFPEHQEQDEDGDNICDICGQVINHAPVVAENAAAAAEAAVGTAWELDLSTIFSDADGDELTYTATVNDAEQTLTGSVLSYTPEAAGDYTVVVTASDGKETVSHTITLTAAVQNKVPVLKEGVSATKEDVTITNYSYAVTELQNNTIFEDPDGDTLDYYSYYYERSADGGQTWSQKTNFPPALYGFATIQFTESAAGTYMYRFYAYDGKGYSEDTWTLTLTVKESSDFNFTLKVGKDYTGSYPDVKFYKTAGIDENGYDYVASFVNGEGSTEYIYDPADYTISKADDGSWIVTADGADYALMDYEPVAYTNSLFGAEPDEGVTATESGTTISNYMTYYMTVQNGRYSYRGYAMNSETQAYDIPVGGMSMPLPTDTNVDGGDGGGQILYLRCNSIYTQTSYEGTYMTEDSYYTQVYAGNFYSYAHAGDAYVKGKYTYYPYLLYAAGNACTYNYYSFANPDFEFPEGYGSWTEGNQNFATVSVGYSALATNLKMSVKAAVEFTLPAGAELEIFYQRAYFNTSAFDVCEGYPKTNKDGTVVYAYELDPTLTSTLEYTWRVTDTTGNYVTVAGSGYPDRDLTEVFSDNYADKHHDGVELLGGQASKNDEADVHLNVSPAGFKTLEAGSSFRVRAFRMWEIVSSITGNYMIEPDFNYQILSGTASVFDEKDGGNGGSNWLDVDPDGTVITAVTYDALNAKLGQSLGGLFPASDTRRTGVFILSDETAGTAVANIPRNGLEEDTTRTSAWDYNYDTWHYYSEETAPELYFTVTDANKVEYAIVTTDTKRNSTLSAWKELTDLDGTYTVDLTEFRTAGAKGGTVIIRMTDASGNYSYQNVKVAEFTVTFENVTNPGEEIMPGNSAMLTFDGLFRGMQKVAGIFNPQRALVRYDNNGQVYESTAYMQYTNMDYGPVLVTIPEDFSVPEGQETEDYVLTNGRTYGYFYGDVKSFNGIYGITDSGLGANFNAKTLYYTAGHYSDIPVEVHPAVYYQVGFNVTADGEQIENYTVVVKNVNGDVITPDENGVFALTYNPYTYEISGDGIVRTVGSFRLGSTTESENGMITFNVSVEKSGINAWDGVTTAEPSTDENGVYRIGTAAELAWFAQTVNAGTNSISAVLTADIELAGYEWTPIGTNSVKFTGSFDGQGHSVHNLAINLTTKGNNDYIGLFGYVQGRSTAFISIGNFKVDGYVKCISSASVIYAYTAGAVGRADGANISSIISDVDVTVSAEKGNWQYTGGVLSYANGTNVSDCVNNGDINGMKYVAGIAAFAGNKSSILRCANNGTISGVERVGGITSYAYSTTPITITSCYNTASVSSAGQYAGSIAAHASAAAITSCYNTASVSAVGANVGGIVGYTSGKSAVNNCFNTGSVTGEKAGGVAGYAGAGSSPTTITNCYYLEGTAETGAGDPQAEQTADFVTAAVMASADFVTVMNTGLEEAAFGKGTNYPILLWQAEKSVIYGDINGDGKINSADAALIYRVVNGDGELTEEQFQTADVNGDSKINAIDASMIYSYVNGKISSFPVENNK